MNKDPRNIRALVRQSDPIDTTSPYDIGCVRGKTILITGGASGFGEAFARLWGRHGANIIIGDINDARGKAVIEEIRTESGNPHNHYIPCNVTDWQSQVDFFHSAVELSPHGGIDIVLANAGITDVGLKFNTPTNLDAKNPPPPPLQCVQVNFIGVMYTAHLALYYLERNPKSEKSDTERPPRAGARDRCLLLTGSVASLMGLAGLPEYCASKHALLGLFRSLRATTFVNGIRVNSKSRMSPICIPLSNVPVICPYFIETPLIPAPGQALLAGAAFGLVEDVVDAASRLVADSRIAGRALCVGPKVRLDEKGELLLPTSEEGKEIAVWEVLAEDFEEVGKLNSYHTFFFSKN